MKHEEYAVGKVQVSDAGGCSWRAVFHMYFRYYNDEYQGRTAVNEDSRSYKFSPWYMITDEAHYFEVDWAAATFISENDGFFTFYIDGDLKYTISGIDNDTHQAEHVLLGPRYGIDPGTSGTIFFDAFESHREDYIGP